MWFHRLISNRQYSPLEHAVEKGELVEKLVWLRTYATEKPVDNQLMTWCQHHLSLHGNHAKSWCVRAWWGVAAGELLRVYLYDRSLYREALAVMTAADWSAIDHALDRGGAILAAAHLGPPKFGMNALISRYNSPLILTNTADMPSWLPEISGPLLNPLVARNRAEIMVKAALHLRAGGVLYGAPDGGFSTSHVAVHEFNRTWRFSTGIPALARMIDIPSFTVLSLWEGNTITLRVVRMKTPDPALDHQDWHRAWIMDHWNAISPIIRDSPENARFLTGKFRRELGTHDLV